MQKLRQSRDLALSRFGVSCRPLESTFVDGQSSIGCLTLIMCLVLVVVSLRRRWRRRGARWGWVLPAWVLRAEWDHLLHHYSRGWHLEWELARGRGGKDGLLVIAAIHHDKPLILR